MITPAIDKKIRSDAYGKLLGATVEAIDLGYCRVSLDVTDAMLNFHSIAHGGIVFGLADIAFAAASNSHGQLALALNMSISFLRPAHAGDHLVAEAKEVHRGGATALYDITVIEKGTGTLVAKCQAMVYRKRETFA